MAILKKRYLIGALLTNVFVLYGSIWGNESANTYLLRAPRSGSHWFFYCTNTLFNKNIYTESNPIPYRGNYYSNKGGGSIVTAHNPYDLQLTTKSCEKDRLILLIRNYRECLLRHYQDPGAVKNEILYQASFNQLSQDKDWVLNLRMNHYFHNLRVYDIWNPEKRLMVYYEDLLQNPQETLQKIADFIGERGKEGEIQEFVDNLDAHMEKSLQIYEGPNKNGYVSHTRGRSFLHHTNKIGVEKSKELDDLVMNCFPDFFVKYLFKYALDFEN